jgi:hypothetical protein
VLKDMDNFYGKSGQTTIHELLEAYAGAVMALDKRASSPSAGRDGSFYNKNNGDIHNKTIVPQSGNVRTQHYNSDGAIVPQGPVRGGHSNTYVGVGSNRKYIQKAKF